MSETTDYAAPFRKIADRLDLNRSEGVSGAACIVPPGDGKRLELLLLRNEEDPAMFWHLIKTHAEIAIQELANAEQQQGMYGRR